MYYNFYFYTVSIMKKIISFPLITLSLSLSLFNKVLQTGTSLGSLLAQCRGYRHDHRDKDFEYSKGFSASVKLWL